MRKFMKVMLEKRWRRYLASFFASLMVAQAMGGVMDVAAYEIGKVNIAPSQGEFYKKDIAQKLTLNKETNIQEKGSVLQKEPEIAGTDAEYDPAWEVKEKRTINSKTYKLPDGSYVSKTYFEPVHKKEGKDFIDIDDTLENTSTYRSQPMYENKEGIIDYKVQDDIVSIHNGKDEELSIVNTTASLDTYKVKENVILYSEAYDNIDMEYRFHGNVMTTNFFINGKTKQKVISFVMMKNDLEVKENSDVLLFLDKEKNVVFSYAKPRMQDANNNVMATSFSYTEESDRIHINLKLDDKWINTAQRTYPIKMNTRIADESTKINVESSYNRSLEPMITSQYYDLFVGYEDGMISGLGYPIGATRTYIHLSNLNLGANKKIVSASLNLNKKLAFPKQWNTIEVGKTANYVDPSTITWNNKPAVSMISKKTIESSIGWQSFDVQAYVDDVYRGKNNTIELKATNESSNYLANVFLGESSATNRPTITITYRDDYDVNPSLPIESFDSEMRLFSILNKGFEALSFDGIARPDAQVIFDLVEKDKDKVILSESSKGNASRYFIDPIYITNHILNTQTYKKDDVNYTTNYVYKDRIPKFDIPYEYKVKVKYTNAISTKVFRTDAFIKYKVKAGDNLKNLASYYGITINEIKKDNNLTENTIKEDDILIIRFKKDNDKVSKDVYTPPNRIVNYKANYVDRGANCVGGVCPVIDPVNSTTGNYYNEENDFTIKDADDFKFMRYYNSTGPQLSNMFGNGFTTPIESYIAYDKEGNMLYFPGDGRIFKFDKVGNGFKVRPSDKMEVTVKNKVVTIKNLMTDSIYVFDAYGYLDTMTSKDGTITSITYDSYGLITSIKVGEKKVSFTYNANKLVKDVTLPNGKQTLYKYDKNRNLIEFKDVVGNVKKYNYDQNNFLTLIIDKNNHAATTNVYDEEGRVLKQTDGNGFVSTITYDDYKTTLTQGDGSVEVYTFDQNYDTISITQDGKITSQNTYDENRNITSSTNENGEVTTYTYDKLNLVKAVYPDGTYEAYTYDTLGNVTNKKDRDGNKTTTVYKGNDVVSTKDSQNMGNSYAYDDKRRVIKETDQFGASKSYTYKGNMIATIMYSNGLVESFEYDENGNTIKESDNKGKIITYVYNGNNVVTQKNYDDNTKEQWTYDGNGNVVTFKDRIGGLTKNSYDKNNNLLSSSKGTLSTSSTYNEINQVMSETDEKGLTKSYTYDYRGNKASEMDPYGNKTTYEYDANNNIIKTIDSFGNIESNEYQNGNLMKSTSKEGLRTSYTYDEYNREIKKVNPNGTVETKTYDGLLLKSEVDGKGTVIEHFYDSFGREIKTITSYKDGAHSTSQKKYDKYGNVSETDVNGAVTKNTYDVYNQLISTTDALGNTTKKAYDVDGNVIKEIDALGNTTLTSYDGNKNVLSIKDKNGNIETKTYNVFGQLLSEKDALGYVKTYHYNKHGLMSEVIDPYKRSITYFYDKYGNTIEIKIEGKTIEKKAYDSHGREIYNETSEAITSSKYDDFDRVIEKTNEVTGLISYTTYDSYGNIVEEKDSEGLSTTYEYDIYNRKIKGMDAYGRKETSSYDARDKVLKTYAYDGTISTSNYDVLGNIIESTDAYGKVTKNTYNVLNQLVRSKVGKKITTYVYDANGKQLEVKNVNNKTVMKNVYDKNGNVIETSNVYGYSSKTKYDAKNQVISTIDAKNDASFKEYDAYGNVIKEIDALGNQKQTRYNAFGLKEIEIDERGFITKYEYNDNLLLTKVIDKKGYVSTLEYNDNRQLIKETNANGGITRYEYDSYGRELKIMEPNGKIITKEFDALGNISKEHSGNKVTVNVYDALGRLTETSMNNVRQTKNEYNAKNQIVKSYDANKNVSTYKYDINNKVTYANEKGYRSEKTYDVEGNVVRQIDNTSLVVENKYDLTNQLLEVKVNGKLVVIKKYDANSNEISSKENGVEERKTYNANNQTVSIQLPSVTKNKFITSQKISYDEASNPITITDVNGNVEVKKYDANNNVIEEKNKSGISTYYEYDGMDNMVKVQNHENRYVSYKYDKANNMILKNINHKFAENTYDKDNNLLSEENENGYKTKYVYDGFNRKVKQIKPDGNKITYSYDALGNKLTENNTRFTYDQRNNVATSTNKEGTVTNTYDSFNNKTSVIDTNGNKVRYTFDKDNQLIEKKYAGIRVSYTYNGRGLLDTVKRDDTIIAKYEYNHRNENTKLKQNNITTNTSYDEMGRVLSQKTTKDGKSVYNAAYQYDANDNVVKEILNGRGNTYKYNAYDELEESYKYIDGKKVKTTYKHDIYGNQVENSSSEGKKVYTYNKKNQVASITTDKGKITLNYDDNGNVSKKVNVDGRVDIYEYDDLNQLTKLEQGQYTYDYRYDGEKERIQQKRTDTKDYHYDVWYTYSESLHIVSDKEIKDTFKNLKDQAKQKRDNGDVCSSTITDSYDKTYFKEPEITDYVVDRNEEYTEVLKANDDINVYGDALLQTNDESIIHGLNESVVAKVSKTNTKKINYNDYGSTKDITSGNSYNGEMLDQTGLIYLRARYYDPSVSRFIQIDNNYDGEKESINSQNKYVYTMNNPYKYVDRDGEKSIKSKGNLKYNPLAYLNLNEKDFAKWLKKQPIWLWLPYTASYKLFHKPKKKETPKKDKGSKGKNGKTNNGKGVAGGIAGGIGSTIFNKGGGSSTKKPPLKKPPVVILCPRPSGASESWYAKYPVKIRISESIRYDTGKISIIGKDSEPAFILSENNKNANKLTDIISVADLGLSITKYGNFALSSAFWLVSSLISAANEKDYEPTGSYRITLFWSVRRKKIGIEYQNGYMDLFYINQDEAGGTIDKYKGNNEFNVIENVCIEGDNDKAPVATWSRYDNFKNNEVIAKEAALYKCGYNNGWNLAIASSHVAGIDYNTKFIYGDYKYYTVKIT